MPIRTIASTLLVVCVLAVAPACTKDRAPAIASPSPTAIRVPHSPMGTPVASRVPTTPTAIVPAPILTPTPPTPAAVASPSRAPEPLPNLPVISISYNGLLSYGIRGSFCWPQSAATKGTVMTCADRVQWLGLDEPSMSVSRGGILTITVQADSAPTRVSVSIFEEGKQPPRFQGAAAVQEQLKLGPESRAELPLDLAPGIYYMSVRGYWPAGDLGHQFKVLIVPTLP